MQRAPLLLVCENNHLAGNVRPEHYLPVSTVATRAAAYGINAVSVDGNRIDDVEQAAAEAINYVRRKSAPFLLECDTIRLGRHKQGQGDIRTKEEKEQLALRDPLLQMQFEQALTQRMKQEIDEIVDRVLASPGATRPKEEI